MMRIDGYILLLAAVGLVLLAALIALLCYKTFVSRTLQTLEHMLEDGINNQFHPERYDETRLSRLESSLYRFFSTSSLSQKQLSADRARIKELIGDISHQTKTPLANILLYAQLLLEQDLPADAMAMAEQIAAQSEKLQFLIAALVKTSRLESGMVQVSPSIGDISPMLAQLEAEYLPRARQKSLSLTVQTDPHTAWFDAKWTTEALGNLVDNAIKYTPLGGQIAVTVREYEMFCRIDVADTGIGIPEDEQSKIFGRFYRCHQVQQEEGVGIGLYLTRQIVSAQGGYVKVTSQPGKGSVFSVYLCTEGRNCKTGYKNSKNN